ncbi:protein TRANSPARENT TESTA [Musa troglodytarum]|uniref:Protein DETOXIFICATION n=1 Tax=Musa troglodytarum TaxID=320322 RepID=A0A9E7H641_9LILI|nr:protein TRANSPARENT TESTA [Musa troglodytarum]
MSIANTVVVGFSFGVMAFAGHLGDLELASISIANTVVVGFSFGLMVSIANTVVVGFSFGLMLGMASALETLCGQAFGARKYHMLGVYMQRSWIVLFMCAVLLLPMYFFATPFLALIGQPPALAAQAGEVSVWFIPRHFSFAFLFPLQRFLQCQLKNSISATVSAVALVVHLFVTWLFVSKLQLGLIGTTLTSTSLGGWLFSASLAMSHAVAALTLGRASPWKPLPGCGSSLSSPPLPNWYYRILILLTGNLKNAEVAVDAISICMSINGWELMIPLAFLAGTGVRVANELGAGNGKGARFATIVSVTTSSVIGLFFCVLIVLLHDKFAFVYTSSSVVLEAVDKLSVLLAFTILLNSVQPVLSGAAVGSGWQALVAYVNIGTYYFVGIPVGILLGWVFGLGVLGIWAGMIGGTAVQTVILAIITVRCDWDTEAAIANARMEKWSGPNKP